MQGKPIWSCFVTASCLAISALASAGTMLLQQPDVGPDRIAFVYAGDVWTTSHDGGDAHRITTSQGLDQDPHFSPDGKWIAFTGQYDGNSDVYIIPAEGGEPTRLTFHPGSDSVRGWTRDGSRVLFISGREHPNRGLPQLWTISTEGGLPEKIPLPVGSDGSYAPDGRRIAYVAGIPAFTAWRGYRGGRTTEIWLASLDDLSITKLPREDSNDHDPVWVRDRIYFLSDRDGAMNLYTYVPESGAVHRLTSYVDSDIKSVGARGKIVVYEYEGELHQYDPDSGETTTLDITVRGDFPWARPHFESVDRMVRNAALSPTGVRAVVEARGEILTLPAEKGDVRNLSDSPSVHDRDPAWSPDGRWIAWFSDEGGEYHLKITEQSGLEDPRSVQFDDPSFYYSPVWSPDSKRIVLTDKHMNIWVVEVESGDMTLVDTDTYSNPQPSLDPVWSPDSKWLAYSKRLDNQIRAIFVYSLEDEESHQVTDGMSDAISPTFDRNGKYMYFAASTNAGRKIGWLDMTSYDGTVLRGLYLVVLDADEPSPLLPESDEEKVDAEDEEKADEEGQDEDKAEEQEASEDEEDADEEAEKKDKDEAPEVTIDLDGIGNRILALDVPSREYSNLEAGPKGTLFYMESVPNQDGRVLHKYDLEEREADTYLSEIDAYTISADGKKLLYAWNNRLGIVETGKSPNRGDGALNTGDLRVQVDPRAEWKQMYLEGWRINRDFFYDEHMHGADWPTVYEKYRPYVDYINHREDLEYVFNLMLGETVSGHSRAGGGDYPDRPNDRVGLLGADWTVDGDRYRIERIYSGESWNPNLRAPLSAPGIDVREGDYLLEVNGDPVDTSQNLYSYFAGTANNQTVLRVAASASGDDARTVTVVPITNEYGLRNRAWVEDNRRKVEELSDGRLAYVYLPNTGQAGYQYFNRYYFSQQNKDGVILDERYNGGGSVADYMIEVMSRELLSFWATRDGKPFASPNAANFGPKVMIVNEYAGSGGDFFPFAFRKRELGPIVGTKTWGGLIGVYNYPVLIDGGTITAPRLAIFSTDGEWIVENVGVPPDIEVEQTPALIAEGRDPQLEKAVEVCLDLLEQNPPPEPNRPEPIDRVGRLRERSANSL